MRTRDEVLLGFGFPLFTEKAIDAAIYAMADSLRELEQEHHEDQGVITVLRDRIERQDTRISKLKRERNEARELSPVDREQMREVVKLAHEVGWNGVENSKILSVFLRDYLTTAERALDEARRERDAIRGQYAMSLEEQVELVRQREETSSQLWDCMNERDGWKHRAERAERVVAAAREWRELEQLWDELVSSDVVTRQEHDVRLRTYLALNELRVAVRDFVAAEGTP